MSVEEGTAVNDESLRCSKTLKQDDGISRFSPNQAHDVMKATQRPSSLKRYPYPISLDPPITRSKLPSIVFPANAGSPQKPGWSKRHRPRDRRFTRAPLFSPEQAHPICLAAYCPSHSPLSSSQWEAGVSDFTLTRACLSLSLFLQLLPVNRCLSTWTAEDEPPTTCNIASLEF